MDPFGPVWPHLTLIVPDSPWLAPIGTNWPRFAPIGSNCQISTFYLIVPDWPQMHGPVLIFVVLYHLYGNKILSCMNKYGVKWSIVILCGFIIGSTLFILGSTLFLPTFLDQKLFLYPKIFWDPKSFCTQNLFGTNILFGPKIFLDTYLFFGP